MDIKKFIFLALIPVIFSLVFTLGYFASSNSHLSNIPSSTIDGGIQRTGIVEITVKDGITGEIKSHQVVHNLAATSGLNALRDIIGGNSTYGGFTFVALGNASNSSSATAPVAGDTVLSGEYLANGLSRSAGTYGVLGGVGNWSVYKTFTSSGISGLTTNKTCLFNQSAVAGATMLACVRFTDVTLDGTSSDTLLINWTNFVSSG